MSTHHTRYWIIVASKDHVGKGVEGGFAQACHGKAAPLRRMHPGDGVLYYSGKEEFGSAEKCQAFTAVGRVADAAVEQVEMSPGFHPYRRRIGFLPAKQVSILPLIEALEFIQNKKNWGMALRYGFLEISQHDFELISSQMTATADA